MKNTGKAINKEGNQNTTGYGKSGKNTLFFKANDTGDFVSFENLIIELLMISMGDKLYIKKQGLKSKNGKHYDVLILETLDFKHQIKLVIDITALWIKAFKINDNQVE